VRKYVDQGQQAYFVLPLIEESEKIDLKSAAEAFEHLKEVFPDLRIDLLHGRMQPEEKEAAMARFKSGETNILVSTTVIEVGVDVPNATVMVIEHAERFGLSQLHQLRGRVGRGSAQSFCVLIYPDDTPDEARGRIETIVRTEDGFEIAEEDLKARGSGEIIGTRQHGDSGLEFADLRLDLALIMAAREEAAARVATLGDVSDILNSLKRHAAHSSVLNGLRQKRILSILS
jgi:ATP-dependent DNA helicase RecG